MRSVLALLLLLPLASCDQSLFDSRNTDAGDKNSIDASTSVIDAGPKADADPAAPDAGPTPRTCVAPCLADPISDYDTKQGGLTGNWNYLSNDRSYPRIADTDLIYGTYGGVPAWVTAGGAPAILNCFVTPDQGACANLDTGLVFVPGPVSGGSDPVLVFEVPNNGSYQLTGTVKTAPVEVQAETNVVTISRNSAYDLLSVAKAVGATSVEVDLAIEAVKGDDIQITLSGTLPSTPVAIDFNLSSADFPGTCQMALTFDGNSPLTDHCAGKTFTREFDDQVAGGVSTSGASVHGNLGFAEHFVYGQNLESTSIMDYDDDFTIQYWLKREATAGSRVYGDVHIGNKGGMTLYIIEAPGDDNLCFYYNDGSAGTPVACIEFPIHDTDWHFLRLTRELAGDVEICVDGVSVGQQNEGSGFPMTSNSPVSLAGVSASNAELQGAMDDIRVFKQALPCALP